MSILPSRRARLSSTPIVFLGDYALIPEESKNATLKKLYLHTVQNGDPSIGHDAVYEQYRNVSCLFHEASPIVREEIDFYIKDIEQSVFDYFNQYIGVAETVPDGYELLNTIRIED